MVSSASEVGVLFSCRLVPGSVCPPPALPAGSVGAFGTVSLLGPVFWLGIRASLSGSLPSSCECVEAYKPISLGRRSSACSPPDRHLTGERAKLVSDRVIPGVSPSKGNPQAHDIRPTGTYVTSQRQDETFLLRSHCPDWRQPGASDVPGKRATCRSVVRVLVREGSAANKRGNAERRPEVVRWAVDFAFYGRTLERTPMGTRRPLSRTSCQLKDLEMLGVEPTDILILAAKLTKWPF